MFPKESLEKGDKVEYHGNRGTIVGFNETLARVEVEFIGGDGKYTRWFDLAELEHENNITPKAAPASPAAAPAADDVQEESVEERLHKRIRELEEEVTLRDQDMERLKQLTAKQSKMLSQAALDGVFDNPSATPIRMLVQPGERVSVTYPQLTKRSRAEIEYGTVVLSEHSDPDSPHFGMVFAVKFDAPEGETWPARHVHLLELDNIELTQHERAVAGMHKLLWEAANRARNHQDVMRNMVQIERETKEFYMEREQRLIHTLLNLMSQPVSQPTYQVAVIPMASYDAVDMDILEGELTPYDVPPGWEFVSTQVVASVQDGETIFNEFLTVRKTTLPIEQAYDVPFDGGDTSDISPELIGKADE